MNNEKFSHETIVDIRIAMLRRGIKQADIARLAGVSPTCVSLVFSGVRASAAVCEAISKLLPEVSHLLSPGKEVYQGGVGCQDEIDEGCEKIQPDANVTFEASK